MRITESKLRRIIREVLIESSSTKNYSEEEIYEAIKCHIEDNKNISSDVLNYIIKTKKSANGQDEVLIKNNQIVFRGMRVEKEYIENLIGSDSLNVPGLYIIDKETVFSPSNKESNTSSWTQSYEESELFMQGFGSSNKKHGIVIVGVTKKENAFNLSGYTRLTNHESRHSDRHEVVMIGEIEVIKIIISNKNNLGKEKHIVPAKFVNFKKGFYPALSRKEFIENYK